MAGTFTNLLYHIIFSTKDRLPSIQPEWRDRLWEYMGGIIRGEGGIALRIGGVADHVHLLVTLKPKHDVSTILQKLKSKSSGWVHELFPDSGMWWQEGYGAFSYSKSQVDAVINYIQKQELHHAKKSFKEEYIDFLEKFEIEYDEKFIFKELI